MSWTSPAELRAQVLRLWERGDLPRACLTDAIDWPLRLNLRKPTATDLTERFEAVRAWTTELARAGRIRLDWAERRHRVQGSQRLPAAAWVDTLDDALAIIGRSAQAGRLRELWQQADETLPALQAWLLRRPLQALELADCWTRLLGVTQWLKRHPRPDIYLRQVDVPGVDSKFIEAQRGVLIELLDLALPPEAIDTSAGGVGQFTRRYGFRDKPARIRLRLPDTVPCGLPGLPGGADITLDAASFSRLRLPLRHVFITENETNFLAFPSVSDALLIFGAGYGWEALAQARWLEDCAIHYWGDIDTHGFGILDQLRGHFAHVTSFLMDRETLWAHEAFWGFEERPLQVSLNRLSTSEQALYENLRDNRIRPGLRLEQERIGFGWLTQRLRQTLEIT